MKPKDLIRALGAADPSDIEEAAPNVHRRGQTPDISAVLDAIRAEQEDGCTAARIEICENKEHRRGLMPVLLGACSMAACALIVAGMAYVLHDNSRLPMTASNVAADVTEITAAAETTAAETTIVLMPDTTTTVTADGMGLHTLPYVRTTAPRDPSAEPADAIETEPPENPDAPKQLPVFIEPEQVVVPVSSAATSRTTTTTTTTAAETTTTTTTTAAASTAAEVTSTERPTWLDLIRISITRTKELCAPSFVMMWESDQGQKCSDLFQFENASEWSAEYAANSDQITYIQENEGFRGLSAKEISGVMWIQYEADGYIPEVREIIFHGGSEYGTLRAALIPADVHGTVRVYLPYNNSFRYGEFLRIWNFEEIGVDSEQGTLPKLTFEEE